MKLKGKTILLGVTGSIAAYKMANVASMLIKKGSGLVGETSERMLYWTAESDNETMLPLGKAATLFVAYNEIYYGVYPLLDESVAASWYSYGARAYAASVRCVKETNND